MSFKIRTTCGRSSYRKRSVRKTHSFWLASSLYFFSSFEKNFLYLCWFQDVKENLSLRAWHYLLVILECTKRILFLSLSITYWSSYQNIFFYRSFDILIVEFLVLKRNEDRKTDAFHNSKMKVIFNEVTLFNLKCASFKFYDPIDEILFYQNPEKFCVCVCVDFWH